MARPGTARPESGTAATTIRNNGPRGKRRQKRAPHPYACEPRGGWAGLSLMKCIRPFGGSKQMTSRQIGVLVFASWSAWPWAAASCQSPPATPASTSRSLNPANGSVVQVGMPRIRGRHRVFEQQHGARHAPGFLRQRLVLGCRVRRRPGVIESRNGWGGPLDTQLGRRVSAAGLSDAQRRLHLFVPGPRVRRGLRD